MNKNTSILIGTIAILAIGVGAYVYISSPSNEGFSTQSFKKTTDTQPTTIVPTGGEIWGDKTGNSKDGYVAENDDGSGKPGDGLGDKTGSGKDGYVAENDNGGSKPGNGFGDKTGSGKDGHPSINEDTPESSFPSGEPTR